MISTRTIMKVVQSKSAFLFLNASLACKLGARTAPLIFSLLAAGVPLAIADTGGGSPLLSHPSGFYEKPFFLRMSHPDAKAIIYYTLDGSEPDPSNLGGTSFSHRTEYSSHPSVMTSPFLAGQYITHRYTRPLIIRDRSIEPDRFNRISTSLPGSAPPEASKPPKYFPSPSLPDNKGSLTGKAISQINRLADDVSLLATSKLSWPGVPMPHIRPRARPTQKQLLKATVVRAAAFIEGERISPINTASFFVMDRQTISLPVVSLVTREDHLFGYENGLFVAGKRFEDSVKSWLALPAEKRAKTRLSSDANWNVRGVEAPAHFQYFSLTGSPSTIAISQDVGIRVHGGVTRFSPNKSIRIYARKSYGKEYLEHAFFGTDNKYKRLLLRNSGNDHAGLLYRDAAIQAISSNLKFDTQAYQPSAVFINGEYWGILNLREHMDKHYLRRVHSVKESNIDLMNLEQAVEGDDLAWRELKQFLETHTLKDEKNYKQVVNLIDIDNFIDYQIANIFFANTDWPHNNQRFWRARTPKAHDSGQSSQDGRWRWLMFDTDRGFGAPIANLLPVASGQFKTIRTTEAPWSTLLLSRLLENDEFRTQFIVRYNDLLNTTFLSSRMLSILDDIQSGIRSEIPRHIQRWAAPESAEQWGQANQTLKTAARERTPIQRQHLADFFSLKGSYRLQVDVGGSALGYVRINSTDIAPGTDGIEDYPYPWIGEYFREMPLRIEARPHHCFSHWEGAQAHGPVLVLKPSADLQVKAVFLEKCTVS